MTAIVIDIGNGEAFDTAIAQYIKRNYNIIIGRRTAEEIRFLIGSAMPLDEDVVMDVRGRDQMIGLPRTIQIHANGVTEALATPLDAIIKAVRTSLEELPGEQATDIINEGIILMGQGALLRRLDALIAEATGVPCSIAVNPFSS